jgi:membrane protease YdiL (CAAX protease family)
MATPTVEALTAGMRQPKPWIIAVAFAQLWLLANGRAALGREFPIEGVSVYLWFMTIPLVYDEKLRDEILKSTILEYLAKIGLGFLLGVAGFFGILIGLLHASPGSIAYSAVPSTVVFHLIMVVPAEELFFRAFLPRFIDPQGKSWKLYVGTSLTSAFWMASLSISDVITSAAFSGFHYAAYGSNAFFAFIVAFVLSLVLLFATRVKLGFPFHEDGLRKPMGIPFSMGIHYGYNLCALGIVTGKIIFGA